MPFYADLHIHSRFARATSRNADLEHMALWAAKKGVSVLGTGDFTHPGWFSEILEKLVPAEPGLFRLKDDLENWVRDQLPAACYQPVRFMLEVEISTIYKKGDKTRKVHHLIYVPDLEAAERLIQSLGRIGNLNADGRPILGLDSRDLLEIALESGPDSYLIPAHIWTPWFAVLGSKSGFDAIEDCYGDLTPHIFALETGLSSDPPMNWRLSQLDRYRLVSNSDAHSPPKIGREACAFDVEMDYFAIRRALETGEGYGGTVEFFPEEGKYHLDGHRKCGISLEPEETRKYEGLCPVCGKGLTVGVMHRVAELADRSLNGLPRERPQPFHSLVPLPEVLGEIYQVGPGSKKVRNAYENLVGHLGSELFILERAPLEDLRKSGSTLLAEGIARMREEKVIRSAGYDGEYGTIRLFTDDELIQGNSVSLLFALPESPNRETSKPTPKTETAAEEKNSVPNQLAIEVPSENGLGSTGDPPVPPSNLPGGTGETFAGNGNVQNDTEALRIPLGGSPSGTGGSPVLPPSGDGPAARSTHFQTGSEASDPPQFKESAPDYLPLKYELLSGLDADQRAAAEIIEGPLMIIAGPGTGKTRTLTHRIAHLTADHAVAPENCLAITFTNRAAGEMKERLAKLVPTTKTSVPVMTFHGLGFQILREHGQRIGLPAAIHVASELERVELLKRKLEISERKARQWLKKISKFESRDPDGMNGAEPEAELLQVLKIYHEGLRESGWVDFDDLIGLPLQLLEKNPELVDRYRERFQWISVDEFQDIDASQYGLIRFLTPADGNLCVIGDPDQSIYGFRGTDVRFFEEFEEDFSNVRKVRLTQNYRSGKSIVQGALQAIAPASLVKDRFLNPRSDDATQITIHESATDKAEAEFIVHAIEKLIGGSSYFSLDSGRVDSHEGETYSFADFGVLYRTGALAETLCEAFTRSGIPFQKHSHSPLGEDPVIQSILKEAQAPPGDLTILERLRNAVAKSSDEAAAIPQIMNAIIEPMALRCGSDFDRFQSELSLGMDVDLWDPRADRVSLLTLHASKGLEFPVVFIAGCEDGLLPLRWGSNREDQNVDEERRLFFVGMTRAKERLFLTHAKKRFWRGQVRERTVSPFVEDIEKELLLLSRFQSNRRFEKPSHHQLDMFS